MSNPPPELETLFASLTKPSSGGQSSSLASANKPFQQKHDHTPAHYVPPSVSSPLFSPPTAGTPPHHGSDIISPNILTPRNEANAPLALDSERASLLLGLLKANHTSENTPAKAQNPVGGPSSGTQPDENMNPNGHNWVISASDLVAAMLAKPSGDSAAPAASSTSPAPQPGNAQEMLLRLLSRPKAPEAQSTESTQILSQKTQPEEIGGRKSSPVRAFGSRESRENTPFELPQTQPLAQGPIFSYVNPFEQLAAASPRPRSPQGNNLGAPKEETKGKEPVSKTSRPRDETDSQANAEPPTSKRSRQVKEKDAEETSPEIQVNVTKTVETEIEVSLSPAAGEESLVKAADSKIEEAQQSSSTSAKEPEKLSALSDTGAKKDSDVLESWEHETERIVPVYSFPLRPFVSITWKGVIESPMLIREDGFMDIARLKKPFDQVDRSLTSADAHYIVYALSKTGGMRVVRQDDGLARHVFRSHQDRIFNVAICRAGLVPPAKQDEAIIGLGVSGSVYWAPIAHGDEDLFEGDALDFKALIFPPYPAHDENASGGALKTRAKPSSRHPQFLAIARGKSIYIVWPNAASSQIYGINETDRTVDSEKFYKERALKISTGKAGKDFAFSDDDTIIASLDKTGRMRFWDIHEMTDLDPKASKPEIRVPLLTLITSVPNEKSWPTSVLFVDKLRPYLKISAMRYMLLGFRQNHTLQLWDLGLGKAVQELNFPHERESDAICSVAYHPGSGVIVVGHPTRNSIYFIHLSAPKYNLPPMSQSEYIRGIVDKDTKLLDPQSTACMSGIRELSFGPRGQLRSLELLPLGKQKGTEDDTGLFELYVMHSRGVTCLSIKKSDLGWSIENKIINNIDAQEKGLIELKELQAIPPADGQSVNGEASPAASNNKESAVKQPEAALDTPAGATQSPSPDSATKELKKKARDGTLVVSEQEPTTADKSDKKKKKKEKEKEKPAAARATEPAGALKTPTVNVENDGVQQQTTAVNGSQPAIILPKKSLASEAATPVPATPEPLSKEVNGIRDSLSSEFSKLLKDELGTVYNRFAEDRRSQDQLSVSRQDAMLRLISTTLSENVDTNLSRMIKESIESTVVPAVKSATVSSMEKTLREELDKKLDAMIPSAVGSQLPEAFARSLQRPETLKSIADSVAPEVAKHVENDITNAIRTKILPVFKNELSLTADKIVTGAEHALAGKLTQYGNQRIGDSLKIEQLTSQVGSLVQIINQMAASQAKFQDEILAMNRRFEEMGVTQQERNAPSAPAAERSPEEIEVQTIQQLMEQGKFEDASIKWVQSTRQAELFDMFFIHCNKEFLSAISPLASLSVGVAVTSSLQTNAAARLDWLKEVLRLVNFRDSDIRQVAPKILSHFIDTLQTHYMSIAQNSPHDPILRKIPPLTRWAREIIEKLGGGA